MPEGPEIRRAADAVAEALEGHPVSEVFFGLPELKPFESQLLGAVVRAVECRGKALLIRFDNGLTIYSHNQLYGRWYTGEAGFYPDSKRQLRMALRNRHHAALLFSASDIAVMRDEEVDQHPFLRKLGPDVLDPALDRQQLIERLQRPEFQRRQLGGLLTQQAFVAGLGNYLRCEILFVAGLAPGRKVSSCGPESLARVADAILRLSRQSYQTGGITNDLQRAERLMAEGASFEEARFHVFRRSGQPCYRCGTLIEKWQANGQPCYLCPQCQSS